MTTAEATLWSCQRRKVCAARVETTTDRVLVALSLDCGHEATHAYPYAGAGLFAEAARVSAEQKAQRLAVAAKAAGTAPCLACGPAA